MVLFTHSPRVLEESVVKFFSVAGFAFAVATATSELTAFQSLSQRGAVLRVEAPVHPDDSFWCVQGLGNHFLNGRGCRAVRGRRQEMQSEQFGAARIWGMNWVMCAGNRLLSCHLMHGIPAGTWMLGSIPGLL